jgi:hypothetical protein
MLMAGNSAACQENPAVPEAGGEAAETALTLAAQVSLLAGAESDQLPASPSLPDCTSR